MKIAIMSKVPSDIDVLPAAAETLRDEAERIRQCQDALVRAAYREAWEEGQKRLRAVLLGCADVMDDKAMGGPARARVSEVMRSAYAAEYRGEENADAV